MKRILVALALLATGCGYQNPTYPTPVPVVPSTAPASIRLTASSRFDYQTMVTATVYTADRHPVANIPISFATAAGRITEQQGATDGNGAATALVSTPTATQVSATIGAISASIDVAGSAPSNTQNPPPVFPPDSPGAAAPSATLNVSAIGTTGVPLTFGVGAPAGQTVWTWTFGDGSTAQTAAYTTTHTYATAGAYTVTVAGAGTRSASATVTISDPPPPAAPPVAPAATLVASLTCTPVAHGSATPCNVAVTYGGILLPSASITSVTWDFGDGSVPSTTVPPTAPVNTRTYVNAGSYTVFATVTATTVDGAKTTTTTKAITVP